MYILNNDNALKILMFISDSHWWKLMKMKWY